MATMVTSKCCGTCEYWNGDRKPGSSIRFDNVNALGVCENKKSSFSGREKEVRYSGCSKYEQWSGLKR